jgi:protein-tyrosine phosphatase
VIDAADRHLRLPGTRNLRDVGGYPAGPGRRIRWGTLLRTDALDRLPDSSQARLLEMGIRQVIDLRWPSELATEPSVFAASSAVRYLSVPLLDNPPAPPEGLRTIYRRMLDERGAQLATVARALLSPDGLPAIVGCAGGIDRTGVTVALLLTAVGVPADVVAADYAMSAACYATDGAAAGLDGWRAGPVEIDSQPAYMLATLDHLEREHGGAAALLGRHGLGPADVGELVERLTEPAA